MEDNTKRLIELRQDLHAMAFNYHYEGWKYRVKTEGYDAVAKDCNDAATRIVTEFEMRVKEHYKNED
jgi:hypothetical protein